MAINQNVQRLSTNTPAFPDLRVPAFDLPALPEDVKARFPSLVLWAAQFNEAHRSWENQLQSSIEKALQAQKTLP
jgi:hypothetical protein